MHVFNLDLQYTNFIMTDFYEYNSIYHSVQNLGSVRVLKEVSSAHHGHSCIYLTKNTVKTIIL